MRTSLTGLVIYLIIQPVPDSGKGSVSITSAVALIHSIHFLPLSPAPPLGPPPAAAPGGAILTEVVRVAEVEHIAAVHVMVEGLLDQVLRLVPGQLRHPGGGRWLHELRGSADSLPFQLIWALPTNQVLRSWQRGGMLILETEKQSFL